MKKKKLYKNDPLDLGCHSMCLSQIEVGLIFFPSKNTSTDYMKIKKKSGMDLG